MRSKLPWRPTSEAPTRQPMLAVRLHSSAWVIGSRPPRPNSSYGLSMAIPNRPSVRNVGSSQPERASAGTSSVYSHTRNPAVKPRSAPRR